MGKVLRSTDVGRRGEPDRDAAQGSPDPWSLPMTLKDMASRVGWSPRRFKRFLEKLPGSFRCLYHTCYQVRLDLLPDPMRRLLEGFPDSRGVPRP